MSRRKGERTAAKNRRDAPYLVEIAVLPGGLGVTLDALREWHAARGLEALGGGWQRSYDQDHVRWCFVDPADADAFAGQFGGARVLPGRARR